MSTTTAPALTIGDVEIVGRLNFRDDVRHADPAPVGPTPDGRWFVPLAAEYDPNRDLTTVEYRSATMPDLVQFAAPFLAREEHPAFFRG